MEAKEQQKLHELRTALNGDGNNTNRINLWRLRELALSDGGLMNKEIRKLAWPKLCGIQSNITSSSSSSFSSSTYHNYNKSAVRDEAVILRDVGRSVWHVEMTSQKLKENLTLQRIQSAKRQRARTHTDEQTLGLVNQTVKLRDEQSLLAKVIFSVVSSEDSSSGGECDGSKYYYYYQGFHDLTALILLNLEDCDDTSLLLKQLAESHLSDFMQPDFTLLKASLQLSVFPLIWALDGDLHEHLLQSGVSEPTFAISWIITWFSHNVKDIARASRLFDVFISSHSSFPIYLTIAMLLQPDNRRILLNTESDFASLHMAIANLPVYVDEQYYNSSADSFSSLTETSFIAAYDFYQELIHLAVSFMDKFPPTKILALSEKYNKKHFEELSYLIPEIKAFQSPTKWCLSSFTLTDRALKAKERTITNKSLKTKRKNKRATELEENEFKTLSDKAVAQDFELAFVASGRSSKAFKRRLNKRRKRVAVFTLVALSVLAVVALNIKSAAPAKAEVEVEDDTQVLKHIQNTDKSTLEDIAVDGSNAELAVPPKAEVEVEEDTQVLKHVQNTDKSTLEDIAVDGLNAELAVPPKAEVEVEDDTRVLKHIQNTDKSTLEDIAVDGLNAEVDVEEDTRVLNHVQNTDKSTLEDIAVDGLNAELAVPAKAEVEVEGDTQVLKHVQNTDKSALEDIAADETIVEKDELEQLEKDGMACSPEVSEAGDSTSNVIYDVDQAEEDQMSKEEGSVECTRDSTFDDSIQDAIDPSSKESLVEKQSNQDMHSNIDDNEGIAAVQSELNFKEASEILSPVAPKQRRRRKKEHNPIISFVNNLKSALQNDADIVFM